MSTLIQGSFAVVNQDAFFLCPRCIYGNYFTPGYQDTFSTSPKSVLTYGGILALCNKIGTTLSTALFTAAICMHGHMSQVYICGYRSQLYLVIYFCFRASGQCVNGVGKELQLEACADKDTQYWVYSNT